MMSSAGSASAAPVGGSQGVEFAGAIPPQLNPPGGLGLVGGGGTRPLTTTLGSTDSPGQQGQQYHQQQHVHHVGTAGPTLATSDPGAVQRNCMG